MSMRQCALLSRTMQAAAGETVKRREFRFAKIRGILVSASASGTSPPDWRICRKPAFPALPSGVATRVALTPDLPMTEEDTSGSFRVVQIVSGLSGGQGLPGDPVGSWMPFSPAPLPTNQDDRDNYHRPECRSFAPCPYGFVHSPHHHLKAKAMRFGYRGKIDVAEEGDRSRRRRHLCVLRIDLPDSQGWKAAGRSDAPSGKDRRTGSFLLGQINRQESQARASAPVAGCASRRTGPSRGTLNFSALSRSSSSVTKRCGSGDSSGCLGSIFVSILKRTWLSPDLRTSPKTSARVGIRSSRHRMLIKKLTPRRRCQADLADIVCFDLRQPQPDKGNAGVRHRRRQRCGRGPG